MTNIVGVSVPTRYKNRAAVIAKYGGICWCCGEVEPAFLDIDHILDDHKSDLERRKNSGDKKELYAWLIKNGFPRDRYQLLCSNCNQGKRRCEGICPHIDKPGYPVAGAFYPRSMKRPSTTQPAPIDPSIPFEILVARRYCTW